MPSALKYAWPDLAGFWSQKAEFGTGAHVFQPSQTKDNHGDGNPVRFLVFARKQWSCASLWDKFEDGHCHRLTTKDRMWRHQKFGTSILQLDCCYNPCQLTNWSLCIDVDTCSLWAATQFALSSYNLHTPNFISFKFVRFMLYGVASELTRPWKLHSIS